jgi:hypothetical protein
VFLPLIGTRIIGIHIIFKTRPINKALNKKKTKAKKKINKITIKKYKIIKKKIFFF